MKNYQQLLESIHQLHDQLQTHAINAVNISLTLRNWLIGFYIVEFEQNGEDRAKYGDNLISDLAQNLKSIKGIDKRSLFRFRQFYLVYPQIQTAFSSNLNTDNQLNTIFFEKVGTLSPQLLQKVGSPSPLLADHRFTVPPFKLISKLSYSHLELLIDVEDQLKRTFYELECIKGTWSVRELKRQINSLYYERSGLSSKPEMLSELTQKNIIPQKPVDIIKNIYSFEFLGINSNVILEESDLEKALLDHLQEFILELGYGFCLEARQKRILIGDTYYFIDLVFYHRLLKCHVLVDLKIGAFEHGDIGQLNTYLNYYKMEIMDIADQAPIGILLVATKDHALVKYATAGMDENLFIQKYMIKLPSKEVLENYIFEELKKL